MKRKDPKYKYKYALLLDDNELDNFINQNTIAASHFANKVYITTGSVSALEFLNNLALCGTESLAIFPEIIFVDINMPMIDGFQFIENLQKRLPEKLFSIKLVILTSSDDPNDRLRADAISKGITFLNKPLTQRMLDQL
jgi:CheY-like chemotaxis protein